MISLIGIDNYKLIDVPYNGGIFMGFLKETFELRIFYDTPALIHDNVRLHNCEQVKLY